MKTHRIKVQNPLGLHLRVAAEVAQTAKKYNVNISICKGCHKENGCTSKDCLKASGDSVLQLLMLDAAKGSELDITVEGRNESAAIEYLFGLFDYGGGI